MMNTDPVTRKVFEFGRSLMMSNVLSAQTQIKVKQQLIEIEKEFKNLKTRAEQDIDRYIYLQYLITGCI